MNNTNYVVVLFDDIADSSNTCSAHINAVPVAMPHMNSSERVNDIVCMQEAPIPIAHSTLLHLDNSASTDVPAGTMPPEASSGDVGAMTPKLTQPAGPTATTQMDRGLKVSPRAYAYVIRDINISDNIGNRSIRGLLGIIPYLIVLPLCVQQTCQTISLLASQSRQN